MDKFCSNCNQYRKPTEGEYIVRNKITRWRCNICKERKNQSPYASKKKEKA